MTQAVPGSSWGTFTIACTIPIALFVGLYMYKLRKGRVVEASLIGAAAVLAATVAGNWIPGSPLEPYFSLSRNQTILAICVYGFIASVLPVWLLLCPRDYLSSFLKIGTIALLVVGGDRRQSRAARRRRSTSISPAAAGRTSTGRSSRSVFICIMCGAISGFHALVSSGTTPKMIDQESDIRTIGYGAMLMEGLVGIVALIAAASLPQGDYWAINIDLAQVSKYADKLVEMGADTDNLAEIEQQVGGESLHGRTGGAVTLAVGMAQIFRDAMRSRGRRRGRISNRVIKYWYHFAIMFEALFILTTIDTGTRIAPVPAAGGRWARSSKPFERHRLAARRGALDGAGDAPAGAYLIWTGSIDTIWPMFGIANQLLAVIALAVVTTVLVNSGRGRYAPLTLLPMLFVITTTLTAGYQMITGPFAAMVADGWKLGGLNSKLVQGLLNIGFTAFVIGSVIVILSQAITRWVNHRAAVAAETVAPGR